MDRPRRTTRQPNKAPQLVGQAPVSAEASDSTTTARPSRVIKRKIADAQEKATAIGTGTGPAIDQEKMFETLMQSSKSDLVSLDMNDIINANTWAVLSDEAKSHLKTLLPPTAFSDWRETLGEDHPCLEGLGVSTLKKVDEVMVEVAEEVGKEEEENAMIVDEQEPSSNYLSSSTTCKPMPEHEHEHDSSVLHDTGPAPHSHSSRELSLSFFTDSHFLAALRTFQDHLYLNYFSDAHAEKVRAYQEGIISGTLAAPWKDEVWERDNPVSVPVGDMGKDAEPSSSLPVPSGSGAVSTTLAGGASQVKLFTLAKTKIIRVGDVIAYRRSFSMLDVVVEKDAIIQSIHPKTYAITVLTQRGTTKDLPVHLLSSSFTPSSTSMDVDTDSSSSESTTLMLTITSPTMLETALLDTDARVDKTRRPNGNAWKAFSVWRYRAGAEYNPYDSRGGRESHGTLFYLRGSYYHEGL